MPSAARAVPRSARRPAFTMIELLVVIAIVVILVALGLTVGAKVSGSGKETLTRETIKVLDSSVAEFVAVQGSLPPPVVTDPRWKTGDPDPEYLQPVVDARNMTGSGAERVAINSVGLYMLQSKGFGTVESIFQGLDSKVVREFDPDGTSTSWDNQPPLTTVFDGFGRPMRYVHPAADGLIYGPFPNQSDPASAVMTEDVLGATDTKHEYGITEVRRNNLPSAGTPPESLPDSDGGVCVGTNPYFYSAGADGDPSTIEDNVYTVKPRFQKE